MTEREQKQAFIDRLRNMSIPPVLDEVDARLRTYIEHVRDNCEGEKDVHNVDEIAGCCRFLRMANAYKIDKARILRMIRLAEKLEWDTKEGYPQKIQLTPLQVYIIAGTVGFLVEKEVTSYGKTFIEERQLVQEAIWFITRKSAKTALDALFMLDDLLYGDVDAECHVVSNNLDQSMIAYSAFKKLLMRIPGSKQAIRINQRETRWLEGQKRTAMVCCHTAGGDAKDGAKASIVIADEYGSAKYVKERCDMSNAIHVYTSSMGTRKNHLWITSTTAGRVISGPFETYLHGAQDAMYKELEYTHDQKAVDDWQFLIAMHPDAWEYSDEFFCQPRLWAKVNPHLGITIQSTFYEEEWAKATKNPDYYKETVTKLFNQFVSDATRPWIQADDIRKLQVPTRIDDLQSEDGWVCYIGMDFSQGNDLNAQSYLCVNTQTGEFFADMDAWIAEDNLYNHPNARLYQQLCASGHLHISKGATIDENEVTNRIIEISEHMPIMRIGYDTYDAKRFVNALSLWIWNEGGDPKTFLRPVSQTWASYNSPTQELEYMIKCDPPLIHFCDNPLWAWEFGNCMLLPDKMDNVKPVKSRENAKVDNVQCLCSAIVLYDEVMGQEN